MPSQFERTAARDDEDASFDAEVAELLLERGASQGRYPREQVAEAPAAPLSTYAIDIVSPADFSQLTVSDMSELMDRAGSPGDSLGSAGNPDAVAVSLLRFSTVGAEHAGVMKFVESPVGARAVGSYPVSAGARARRSIKAGGAKRRWMLTVAVSTFLASSFFIAGLVLTIQTFYSRPVRPSPYLAVALLLSGLALLATLAVGIADVSPKTLADSKGKPSES